MDPIQFCLAVHAFGDISPSISNFAMQKTVRDHLEFEKKICHTVKRSYYVDEEEAVRLLHKVQELMATGGLNLTSVMSNSRRVLNFISEKYRAKPLNATYFS